MTSKTLLSKLKTRFILALIILGLLCASLFFLAACSDDEETDNTPSYTYTDTDDGLISNPDFNYNTAGIKLANYPQTSPTGWSRAKDSDGISSSAKSGVVDVSEEGWKALLKNIYSDTYFVQYLESQLGFSKSDEESALKEENPDITADELKEKIVEKYISKLTAPQLKTDATDTKVYMLNNYTSNLGIGASQKITSSNSITIKKGEYVKITVDVLTQNIQVSDGVTLGMKGAENDFGASIRLTNTFSGTSMQEYAITNINTNGEWKTYTIYAKGDAEFDCTVTLALGLGYSNLYPTQGTVYFDNITAVDGITEEDIAKLAETDKIQDISYINYTASKASTTNADDKAIFCYDMNLGANPNDTTYNDYNKAIEPLYNDVAYATANKTITVSSSNATLTVKDTTNNFVVASEQYAYVSFKLNNKLDKLGSTSVTVDVYETSEGGKKYPAVATITETGETTVGVMIKNNFDEKASPAYPDRTFYLVITVGPTDLTAVEKLSDYASGEVTISDFKIAKGATYQYDDNDNETENYKYYTLLDSVAKGSTSLYAGQLNDFVEAEENTASTGFSVHATQKQYLTTQLLAPKDYAGVVSNHIYLTSSSTAEKKINTRLNGENGSYAGVIDTKYVNDPNYDKPSTLPTLEEDIRPLMIYNHTADSYGYISNADAQVIAANSYAKVSVKVWVGEGAKAYIYLVDTSTKEIMTFDTFTPNSTGLASISSDKQQEKVGEQFKFEVPYTNGEWVDVVFYIATGATEKSFRVELWNGSRDGESKSEGYVFFNSVNVGLSSAFTEPTTFKDSFTSSTSPLNTMENALDGKYLCYTRPLTETEKEFNEEYPDKAVSYSPKIVWAKNDKILYAIFNTIDATETDPYETLTEEDTEEESGCAAETDPATFWLSFSSILLAVVLFLAILALFIKNIRRRRKARAKDAKSHYTVKSRVRKAPKSNKKNDKEEQVEADEKEVVEDNEEIIEEEAVEELPEESSEEAVEEEKEQTLDDYVYGDVQDFGEEGENN